MDTLTVYTLTLGPLETNCYLLAQTDSGAALCIDPAAEAHVIINAVSEHNLRVEAIALTHGHGDHIAAVSALRAGWEVPVWIHSEDAAMLTNSERNLSAMTGLSVTAPPADSLFEDGDSITFGGTSVSVLHTPGHTRGGVSFYVDRRLDGVPMLFSGDTLFCGGVGRYDLPGGSWETLQRSIREKLYTLPDDTVVYPGHGPATTIGREKRLNQYV